MKRQIFIEFVNIYSYLSILSLDRKLFIFVVLFPYSTDVKPLYEKLENSAIHIEISNQHVSAKVHN